MESIDRNAHLLFAQMQKEHQAYWITQEKGHDSHKDNEWIGIRVSRVDAHIGVDQ